MNKSITLLACSLLLTSNYALANRPAMSERDDLELEVVEEISPIIEEKPVAAPEAEDMSAVEVEMQQESVETEALEEVDTEATETEAEPVIHVYDHRTETEITGDVIEMQQGDSLPVRVVDFPRRGMKMDKVRNELGEPLEMSDAIGTPPITTWTYRDRVVYFEYSSVVHVVATP